MEALFLYFSLVNLGLMVIIIIGPRRRVENGRIEEGRERMCCINQNRFQDKALVNCGRTEDWNGMKAIFTIKERYEKITGCNREKEIPNLSNMLFLL